MSRGVMVPKVWPLLDEAIEVGLARGWRLAEKHLDADQHATPEAIQTRQHQEILTELCERFRIDEEENDDA